MLLLAACAGIGFSAVEEDEARPASDTMPHYEIEFTLSDDLNYLQGSAHIRVPNTSADPWDVPDLSTVSGAGTLRRRVQHSERGGRGQYDAIYLSGTENSRAGGAAAGVAARADSDCLSELAVGDPAMGRGYRWGLPPVRLQSGYFEPAALLPFAGGLPAWADRGERTLVAGEGHQPRGRSVQLYIPIRRHRHSAERSDPRDERQTDHLDNDQ